MEQANDPGLFVKKWGATIAFLLLFLSQAYVTYRLFEQNKDIEALVEQQAQEDCTRRQASRETLRETFQVLIDFSGAQNPDAPPDPRREENVQKFLVYIDSNYPSITCPEAPTKD